MSFVEENIQVVCLTIALVFAFLYGRYQYLSGYLKACKLYNAEGIITENEKNSHGEAQYLDGYTDGLIDGIEKHQEILQKAETEANGGWVDEASEWRKIAQEFIVNISKGKSHHHECGLL